jgi:hypothetical protein
VVQCAQKTACEGNVCHHVINYFHLFFFGRGLRVYVFDEGGLVLVLHSQRLYTLLKTSLLEVVK